MGKPNKNKDNNKKTPGKNGPCAKKKRSSEDHAFCTGIKQASDCEVTLEFVLNHIKKTCECGNDTSESLRKLDKVDTNAWKPTLKASTKADPAEKAAENKQFEIEFKAELDKTMRRTDKCDSNLCKAHAACLMNYWGDWGKQ